MPAVIGPVEEHWLRGVRRCRSPNQDQRPEGEVSALVLHSISLPPGVFGGDEIERLFTNTLDHAAHPYFAGIEGLRVSAHLLIRRDGECVQFVAFDRRAWHAGQSQWEGRSRFNDFSIGIELEGDERSFTLAQYRALATVFAALSAAYPGLNEGRIFSHQQIAPRRKYDPGPSFDWALFRRMIGSGFHS
ncbi:N-acetyl-anhydromuranmyl-L-alanine amidase [Halotalea alkalilenta]|uniref:1,6-anhydro-N-acetylmuramyl-L-alanine amidase AmpD n=1 Tax=Halotalea alkalilenta TaxID=376489 RepID=A0A172YI33_9GAMM|nr:N-acetyl-anhydromuranmyl-L-alanine amidase [Halotalea alkalilenta]